MFLAEVGQEEGKQLLVMHFGILDIIEGSDTISLSLTSKLSRNIQTERSSLPSRDRFQPSPNHTMGKMHMH